MLVLVLFTDPEGDSCFTIYQISWIKKEKVTFCKLKMSLGRNFVNNLQTFCRVHFTILLQIQHENNFLPTNKCRQAKVRHFLGIAFMTVSIITQILSSKNVSASRCHLGSGGERVNS